MYHRILVAIENSAADRTILTHVTQLARLTGAELLLVHVADGWAARHFDELKLRESEEMKADRAYLEQLRADLAGQGFDVETRLAMGDPATELIRAASRPARRPHRHVDARPPLPVRHPARGNGGSRPPPGQDSGAAPARPARALESRHTPLWVVVDDSHKLAINTPSDGC